MNKPKAGFYPSGALSSSTRAGLEIFLFFARKSVHLTTWWMPDFGPVVSNFEGFRPAVLIDLRTTTVSGTQLGNKCFL